MKIAALVLAVILVAGSSVLGYYGFLEYRRSVDNEAIHQCAQDYRRVASDAAGITVDRPLEQQVRECAWQKGVRDWDGVWSDLLQ